MLVAAPVRGGILREVSKCHRQLRNQENNAVLINQSICIYMGFKYARSRGGLPVGLAVPGLHLQGIPPALGLESLLSFRRHIYRRNKIKRTQ